MFFRSAFTFESRESTPLKKCQIPIGAPVLFTFQQSRTDLFTRWLLNMKNCVKCVNYVRNVSILTYPRAIHALNKTN